MSPKAPAVDPRQAGLGGELEPSAGGINARLDAVRKAQKSGPPYYGKSPLQAVKDFVQNLGEVGGYLEEKLTDRMARVNKIQGLVEQEWRKTSSAPLPLELQTETLAGLAPGGTAAGMQRWADGRQAIQDAAGPLLSGWKGFDGDLDKFLIYKRIQEIEAVKGPRLNPFKIKDAAEAQRGLDELQGLLGPERWRALQDAGAAAVAVKHQQLDRMVDAGLITQELADDLRAKYPYYYPMRYMEYIAESGTPTGKRLSVSANTIKRLGETGSDEAVLMPLDATMMSTLFTESVIFRNQAARSAGDALQRLGLGKKVANIVPVAQVEGEAIFRPGGKAPENAITYFENGKRVFVETDPKIARVVNGALTTPGFTQGVAAAINNVFRAAYTSLSPTFLVPNFVSDWMNASVRGVKPSTTFRSLAAGLRDLAPAETLFDLENGIKGIVETDPVWAEALRRGAGMASIWEQKPEAVMKAAREQGATIIRDHHDLSRVLQDPLGTAWDVITGASGLISKPNQVIEQVNRRAVFVTELERRGIQVREGVVDPFVPEAGMSKADVDRAFAEAALASRRGTIDFARGGEWTKDINYLVMFMNASTQGFLLPFRALKENPKQVAPLIGGFLGAQAGLYAWNRQFEEYEDVPRDIRYGAGIIMGPSKETDPITGRPKPNYIAVVPRTREWGMFLGPLTYLLEKLDQKQTPGFGEFIKTVGGQVSPVPEVSKLVPTPLGQAAIGLITNYDSYRNRQIVPLELQGKPAIEQYDPYTQETVLRVAKALGISPMMAQYAVNTLGGGLGRSIISASDAALRKFAPAPVDPRIQGLVEELKGIGPDRLKRREFLNVLSAEDREAVSKLERLPKEQIPIVGPMLQRFRPGRAGELTALGRERAKEQTDFSPQQTSVAGQKLSARAAELQDEQRALDAKLDAGKIDWREWRDRRTEIGVRYNEATKTLKHVFPSAAQLQDDPEAWKRYQETLNTLGGQIPDRRDQGQVLAAAYRAIPMLKDEDGEPDYDAFFRMRDELIAALPKEDAALLQGELDTSSTPREKEWAAAQKMLRPYFKIRDQLQTEAAFSQLVRDHDRLTKTEQKGFESRPQWKLYQRILNGRKEQWRKANPLLDKVLQKYGYVQKTMQERAASGGGGFR